MSDQNLLRPDPLIPLDPTSPAGLLRLAAFIRGREDSDASADMLARGYQELHAQLATAKADGAREALEALRDVICSDCKAGTRMTSDEPWHWAHVGLYDVKCQAGPIREAIRKLAATPKEDVPWEERESAATRVNRKLREFNDR